MAQFRLLLANGLKPDHAFFTLIPAELTRYVMRPLDWVYVNRGAVLPMLTVPSIIGVMLGAKVGARLLRTASTTLIRRSVLILLLLAATRALLKGFGIWN